MYAPREPSSKFLSANTRNGTDQHAAHVSTGFVWIARNAFISHAPSIPAMSTQPCATHNTESHTTPGPMRRQFPATGKRTTSCDVQTCLPADKSDAVGQIAETGSLFAAPQGYQQPYRTRVYKTDHVRCFDDTNDSYVVMSFSRNIWRKLHRLQYVRVIRTRSNIQNLIPWPARATTQSFAPLCNYAVVVGRMVPYI